MHVAEIDDTEYRQVSAYVGENITLYCNTSLDTHVDWNYNYNVPLYDRGNTLHQRFVVDRSVPKEYNLVMPNVRQNDSGRYSCVEDSGLGRSHVFTVNITGRHSACCFR